MNKQTQTAKKYTVRKEWEDNAEQIGTFERLRDAKEEADKNKGYKVYNWNGKIVYPKEGEARKIKVTAELLNVRKGPGKNHEVISQIKDKGIYTIAEESGEWGKLESIEGWICMEYTEKV